MSVHTVPQLLEREIVVQGPQALWKEHRVYIVSFAADQVIATIVDDTKRHAPAEAHPARHGQTGEGRTGPKDASNPTPPKRKAGRKNTKQSPTRHRRQHDRTKGRRRHAQKGD